MAREGRSQSALAGIGGIARFFIQHGDSRIMMDCGRERRDRLNTVAPTSTVLTHAHLDHAYGLTDGAPCPVYATNETFNMLRHLPVPDRRKMRLGKSIGIDGVMFMAFPVHHSIHAPADGYLVSVESCSFIYLPDVADLPRPPLHFAESLSISETEQVSPAQWYAGGTGDDWPRADRGPARMVQDCWCPLRNFYPLPIRNCAGRRAANRGFAGSVEFTASTRGSRGTEIICSCPQSTKPLLEPEH